MPWQRDFSKIPPVKASSVSKTINPSTHQSINHLSFRSFIRPYIL